MTTNRDPIVIVSTQRTPIGQFMGCFQPLTAPQLGSIALKGTLERVKFEPSEIDEVIMGCVLAAGMGQAPARQASIFAEIPHAVGCTTINKMCGSGMKAVMLGYDSILAETNNIVLAGGQESMSNAPYLMTKARTGLRMGHGEIKDHMFLDGLEDAYDKGTLMGVYAETCAEKFGFTRQEQDNYTLQSLEKAQKAIKEERFLQEITPVTVPSKKENLQFLTDELPGKARPEKIPTLRPAFKKDGTVTAANSSAISDGAAAHLLMRQSQAKNLGLKPLAVIVAHATHSQVPAWFTTAPVSAVQKVLEKANWKSNDVDLFEINEAFAVVTLAAMKELNLPPEKVNVHGGACALGHPIGASGARILTTLIHALHQYGKKRGIASLCIGGGEATAIAVEVI